MASTQKNEAAWAEKALKKPFKVGPAPYPEPSEREIVIQVAYAAVNPTDWKMQEGDYLKLDYPTVLGTDVAGTIVGLGSSVNTSRFHIGQRVIGHCDGLLSRKASHAGYQKFSIVSEILCSPVPDSLPLENAAVLPLSISTAASGLFVSHKLPFPSMTPKSTSKTILIWGGSSSCGSSAIQLAKAAGLNVITTASRANFDYVKNLGASQAFDHTDSNVEKEVAKVLKPGDYILDCIASDTTQVTCGKLLSNIGGGRLPTLLWPTGPFPDNVEGVLVNGLDPGLQNLDVGEAVWGKYIPEALANGSFKAKPEPFIVQGGLEKVQEGVDLLKSGVSAKKIVIEIAKE